MRNLLALLLGLTLALPAGAQYPSPTFQNVTVLGTLTTPPSAAYIPMLSSLARIAANAAGNNPRVNAVMASPPTITPASRYAALTAYTTGQVAVVVTGTTGNFYTCATGGTTGASSPPSGTGSGITDGTVTWNWTVAANTNITTSAASNSYQWASGTGPRRGVFNLYGGVPTNDSATTVRMYSVTVSGVKTAQSQRVEFIADSAKFVIRTFESALPATTRFIIDGRYASMTAISPPKTGHNYYLLDFTSAGGRAARDIVMELNNVTYFNSVDVLTTENVFAPGGARVLKGAITGDSIGSAAGVTNYNDGFHIILADLLGIRNMAGTAIGGQGLLQTTTSGTAISRIADIVTFAPDILIEENGYNDATNAWTPAQIQAAELDYLRAIRASSASMVIFVMGIPAERLGGASWAAGVAAENAKFAAVATMADPLIFAIPLTTDPNGSWFTGTGYQGATNSSGNSDVYIFTDATHPNTAGHLFLANRMADAIRRILNAGGY